MERALVDGTAIEIVVDDRAIRQNDRGNPESRGNRLDRLQPTAGRENNQATAGHRRLDRGRDARPDASGEIEESSVNIDGDEPNVAVWRDHSESGANVAPRAGLALWFSRTNRLY